MQILRTPLVELETQEFSFTARASNVHRWIYLQD